MVMSLHTIEGYPNYTVDCYGGVSGPRGHLLVPCPTSKGYMSVSLCGDYTPRTKAHSVHRLVAEAFLSGRAGEVNHKDANKRHNEWHNLEWISSTGNKLHATAFGLYPTGPNHYRYKDGTSDRGRVARRKATLETYQGRK